MPHNNYPNCRYGAEELQLALDTYYISKPDTRGAFVCVQEACTDGIELLPTCVYLQVVAEH